MKEIARLAWKILLIQIFVLIPHNTGAASSQQLPEGLLTVFGEAPATDRETERQIASVLQKLGKTLILERTRGAKEIAVYRKAAPAVVFVVAKKENSKEFSTGSGAIIDGKGHVITNWHVVQNHPHIFVVFKPKDSVDLKRELVFSATLEKVDQVADLALLKIDNPPKAFASLRLGDISTLTVGQDVHAIGHPHGEVWTYTKGIISQIRPKYKWDVGDGIDHKATVIQTQTPTNAGSSGGPLLDDGGRVIGVNSFVDTKAEGLNYAVAVDVVKAFLKRKVSRKAPTTRRSKAVTKGPECPETYDTTGQGWPNILGCYARVSTPPPDAWIVLRGAEGPLAYVAFDWMNGGQIDKVVIVKDQSNYHFIDIDCDGSVDVIGHQFKDKEIDSYRNPAKPLTMVSLAKELDSALKTRKIPHRNLRVCQ
jgi:S1-C subfamily serine protease